MHTPKQQKAPPAPQQEEEEEEGTAIVLHSQHPLSPESTMRQRKRSADMMDSTTEMLALGQRSPPPPTRNESNQLQVHHPMTPPPCSSQDDATAQAMALSPPDAKRTKRLTLSPKTPLGSSNYTPKEGGGLSASQRVRLSLSGYMTIATLTGSGRRDSGAHGTNTRHSDAAQAPPQTGESPSASSSSSHARSKFAVSRSLSGPATQTLLTTKNSLECLMGYMQELKQSEHGLRKQLAFLQQQRHEDLSRSVAHITHLENDREQQQQQVQQMQRIIQELVGEVQELRQHTYGNAPRYSAPSTHPRLQDDQEHADFEPEYEEKNEYVGQWGAAFASPAPESHTTSTSYPDSGLDDPYRCDQQDHDDAHMPVYRGSEQDNPHFVANNYETEWADEVQSIGYESQAQTGRVPAAPSVHDFPPPSPMPTPSPVWLMAQSARRNEAPPAFSVAPRLSDIIAPLSQFQVFTPDTTDHNVLKPVTPQALSSGKRQTKDVLTPLRESPSQINPAVSVTDPSPQPPAVIDASPLPTNRHQSLRREGLSAEPQCSEVGGTSQAEEFQRAQNVFKPFHQLNLTSHKTSCASVNGPTPQVLEKLLVEFFTAVDRTKLQQAAVYAKRYRADNIDKLFAGLSKKYGAAKIVDLQHKYEQAAASSFIGEVVVSPSHLQAAETHPQKLLVNPAAPPATYTPPPQFSPDVIDSGSVFSSPAIASTQPFTMSTASFVGHDVSNGTPVHSIDSRTLQSVVNMSPTKKVSPTPSKRRGQPLPFAFPDDHEPGELPPVIPMTSMSQPPLTPTTATPPPPRIAPSPPRGSPPSGASRSPVRNGSVLRQRVSPQKQSRPPMSPFTSSPVRAPRPAGVATERPASATLSPSRKGSPTAGAVITLESLLQEFYTKHQPDQLKNVPELVHQYTGKERELVASLKSKYGALNVKRFENYQPLLEQQNGSARGKRRRRGCVLQLLFTLVPMVMVFCVAAFGGLIAVNHSECHKEMMKVVTADAIDCGDLLVQVTDKFEMDRLGEYVNRNEQRNCFCGVWVKHEELLMQEPSVDSARELAKLTVFSRAVVQPVLTSFVSMHLPSAAEYTAYANPVLQISVDVTVTAIKIGRSAFQFVAEQWTTMNNKPRGDTVNPHVHERESRDDDSPVDALTKAAMASKSLVEPRTIERSGKAVEYPAATTDLEVHVEPIIANDVSASVSTLTVGEDGVDTADNVEEQSAPVEEFIIDELPEPTRLGDIDSATDEASSMQTVAEDQVSDHRELMGRSTGDSVDPDLGMGVTKSVEEGDAAPGVEDQHEHDSAPASSVDERHTDEEIEEDVDHVDDAETSSTSDDPIEVASAQDQRIKDKVETSASFVDEPPMPSELVTNDAVVIEEIDCNLLEDPSGLDPLALLDLADLAAAAMYSSIE